MINYFKKIMKVTSISNKGIDLIKSFEGFESKAYVCPAGVVTIGYGATYWEDGRKIKLGETITQEKAIVLLNNMLIPYCKGVDSMTRDDVSQSQFDALVSFAYNCGLQALKGSTLLKKVNAMPNDMTIADEFLKWNKANGKALAGLTRRRKAESDMYFGL